jgi:hypothetical protein
VGYKFDDSQVNAWNWFISIFWVFW